MRKIILALVLVGLLIVVLFNSPFSGGPTYSTVKIDINSGQIKTTKLFLSLIPYSRDIENTFLSQGRERNEKREWIRFAGKHPNIHISYSFRAGGILRLEHLIETERIAIEREAIDELRDLSFKSWSKGNYRYPDFIMIALADLMLYEELEEGKTKYLITTESIDKAVEYVSTHHGEPVE